MLLRLPATVAAVWFVAAPASAQLLGTPEANEYFGRAVAHGDFNGDSFDDLAIAAYGDNLGAISDAGAVHVVYGSAAGLTEVGNQVWTQDSPGIDEETAENTDSFGWALAAGDFDGDGFDDLAVGVPKEDFGPGSGEEGLTHVLYGSFAGLTAAGNQVWTQESPGILEDFDTGDNFGWLLAAGDLNGDGFDDLAITAFGETFDTGMQNGGVHVLYGSANGLTAVGNELWGEHSPGMPTVPLAGPNSQFGRSLAMGDFDGDGMAELVIGAPTLDVAGVNASGGVVILAWDGSALAPQPTLWSQDLTALGETPEPLDNFGDALATGDFNQDGFDDLAIGVYSEDLPPSVFDAGLVHVLYGSAVGVMTTGAQHWTQDSPGLGTTADAFDKFSQGLAAGDFDGDGFDDLAVGAPEEDIGAIVGAGAVTVLRGSATGLTATGSRTWQQGADGVLDAPDRFNAFGYTLTTGDFDGDGAAALAVGAHAESIGGSAAAGAVNVISAPLSATDPAGLFLYQGAVIAVASEGAPETGFTLSAVSPNPLAARGALSLTVDRPQYVRVEVVDILGRRLVTLFDGPVGAAEAVALRVEAGGLAPGVYVVRVRGEAFAASRRLTVAR